MAAVIPVVTRISSRVIRILGCNPGPMTLQGTNTYLIGTGKSRMLIDTGDYDVPQYLNTLRSLLKKEDITLSHIFISHWHHDHIGGLPDVLDLKDRTKLCRVWKYPRNEDVLPNNVHFDFLKDGQEFNVEGATLRIMHTPGHTTDHVCFHLLEENALFSADCILGEGTAVFEDLFDYMNSLENILELKPALVYPGHGNIVKEPQEKIKYYIEHRKERERQILEVLTSKPKKTFSEMDIVKIIYTDTPEQLYRAAAFNVNHHLNKLLKEKKVEKIDELWQMKTTLDSSL